MNVIDIEESEMQYWQNIQVDQLALYQMSFQNVFGILPILGDNCQNVLGASGSQNIVKSKHEAVVYLLPKPCECLMIIVQNNIHALYKFHFYRHSYLTHTFSLFYFYLTFLFLFVLLNCIKQMPYKKNTIED